MHTRRVGAFLVGAWLIGSLLIWFITSQSAANVDRILSSPPTAVAKELDDLGRDVSRQILRFQALQHNRHVSEAWEVMQLGLGTALLATSILTSHRSKALIGGAFLMTIMAAIMAFFLTPTINALARSYDFLPVTAAAGARESVQFYEIWHRVLEVLKTAIGSALAARLLFDRYNWREKLMPSVKKERRRRVHRSPGPESTGGPAAE